MKILAIITARAGSKRIPGKNKRLLGGIPLIMWSINTAKKVDELCDILVSTDDPDIAKISESANVLVPWLRPNFLATDTATSVDVCLHAITWYEKNKYLVDGVLLLQPSSPFRNLQSITRGINIFKNNMNRSVVGVSKTISHPEWCFRIEGDRMHPYLENFSAGTRSQDLPEAYIINGGFYLISTDKLKKEKTFFSKDMIPLEMNQLGENIDIDTEFDWDVAETQLKYQNDIK